LARAFIKAEASDFCTMRLSIEVEYIFHAGKILTIGFADTPALL